MTIPKQSIKGGVSLPLVETRFIASGPCHLPEYTKHHPEKTDLVNYLSDHHHAAPAAVRRDESRLYQQPAVLGLLPGKNHLISESPKSCISIEICLVFMFMLHKILGFV